jgi:type 1 glutamine amidotransferase
MLVSVAVISCSGPTTGQTSASSTPESTASTTSTDMGSSPSTTSQPTLTTRSVPPSTNVLVFHRTEGFRHDSIEVGIDAVVALGGYQVTATEDPAIFTSAGLEPFAVVVFLNTTGDVLDEAQQRSLEQFITSGKGFVGVHSAADTEYDWDWYGGLVGAYFDSHPTPQTAVARLTASHPVVEGLPEEMERFDEWYDFRSPPAGDVTVLAVVDESTYEGGAMGSSHPIVWAHEYEGGRAVYVGFGHTVESFEEPLVMTLLDNAIRWAGSLD